MAGSSENSAAAIEMVEGLNQSEITLKGMKFQEIVVEGEEDRISALPDSLIIEILSRLPSTKGAIRTGTLSKRWKHLWTWVSTLIFKCTDRKQPFSDFVSVVDKTLAQCRQLKLNKFEVFTNYYDEFEPKVNNWIRYAISCNVEELLLKLCCTGWGAVFQSDQLLYISSCFTHLTLGGCNMNPTGEISWKNLRSLHIFDVELDETLIENILSGSPVLETLALINCYGYERLDITSKSVKKLVFCGYKNPKKGLNDLPDIEINAPDILSLTIQGTLVLGKLLLLNVSSLVEANLGYEMRRWYYETMFLKVEEEILKGYIQKLSHVKELKIGVHCSKVVSRLEDKGFVVPSNIGKVSNDFFNESGSDSCDW